jgi:dTDP-4-amino-4,6-dideoxygalactose transaminase
MNIKYIDLSISSDEYEHEISPLLKEVFLKGNFVGGEEIEKFENNFASYCNTLYAVALNSGTDALILALKALGIKCGDEVITVSNSFISTANAIEWVGAKAVFVDVGGDLLIDTKKIEKAITNKTKAIIPVHLMGLSCDMDEVNQIAKKYNIKVIEDAAQSVGSMYKGKKTGSLGDIGCFSLHPLKNLGGIGDGGIITTNDKLVADTVKILRNNGLKDRDSLEVVGVVSRLDTINAVILNHRLNRLDEVITQRRKKAKLYLECLKKIDNIECIKEVVDKVHSYHTFIIKVQRRKELREFLSQSGIETKIHYPKLIHTQKPYLSTKNYLQKSEELVEKILTLPLANVKEEEIKHICNKIKDFYNKGTQ